MTRTILQPLKLSNCDPHTTSVLILVTDFEVSEPAGGLKACLSSVEVLFIAYLRRDHEDDASIVVEATHRRHAVQVAVIIDR
jgi:hypothetical protein